MHQYDEVDVQSPSNARPCIINGLQVLPDGRLVVGEFYDKYVKLFDTNHKLIDKLKLQGGTWDITVVGDDQVLVSVNIVGVVCQMQFVIVTGRKLRLGHSFQIKNINSGIVYFEDQLFVIDNTDETIKVLDMTGNILRTMDKSPDWPQSLAVSPANRVLYVSNGDGCTVKCMTIDGQVLNIYKHGQTGFHEQLTAHPDGSVYVTDWRSDSIHHITSQCTHIETLFDHGEVYCPMRICVNPSGDRLYVSESKRSLVKVFSLGDQISRPLGKKPMPKPNIFSPMR